MDAKEEIEALREDIAAWRLTADYWIGKAKDANSMASDVLKRIAKLEERLAAELSQVSA